MNIIEPNECHGRSVRDVMPDHPEVLRDRDVLLLHQIEAGRLAGLARGVLEDLVRADVDVQIHGLAVKRRWNMTIIFFINLHMLICIEMYIVCKCKSPGEIK